MHVIFFGGSFLIELTLFPLFSPNDIGPPIFLMIFWGICIFLFGVLDVIFAIYLLKDSKLFSKEIKVFAILALIMCFVEISVIFSFMNMLLIRIVFGAWSFVFFNKKHEVEFV